MLISKTKHNFTFICKILWTIIYIKLTLRQHCFLQSLKSNIKKIFFEMEKSYILQRQRSIRYRRWIVNRIIHFVFYHYICRISWPVQICKNKNGKIMCCLSYRLSTKNFISGFIITLYGNLLKVQRLIGYSLFCRFRADYWRIQWYTGKE